MLFRSKHNEEKVLWGKKYKCSSCNKEYQKKWYKNNAAAHKQKISINRKKSKQENRDYIYNFLSNSCCNTCGEKDILVLEFDHLHNKKHNISEMISSGISVESLKKEIEKCQVLCANCHRRKTAIEQNHYRFSKQNELIKE